MRTVLILLTLCSAALQAQRGRGGRGATETPVLPAGPPKNLKVLPADTNIPQVMGAFRAALGVQCTYCHAQGDFPSDENPKKSTARNMLRVTADINGAFPDGQRHVTCYTCHRGEAVPKTEPAAPDAKKPAAPPE